MKLFGELLFTLDHRFANPVIEEVAGIFGARILKLFEQSVAAAGQCSSTVKSRSLVVRVLEPQLQNPVCPRTGKKPGKEPVERHLPTQALQISFLSGPSA